MITIVSERGREMIRYVPRYYDNSRVYVKGVIEPQGAEFDQVRSATNSVLDQFYARRATWGLDIWEEENGLAPDSSLTISERQDRLVSKIRGNGTATIRVIKLIASSYQNGEVVVAQDSQQGLVIIRFVGQKGIPSNINDLKQSVREIVPAHLGIVYLYTFLIWDDIDRMDNTWDEWDALGLTWDELEVYQ